MMKGENLPEYQTTNTEGFEEKLEPLPGTTPPPSFMPIAGEDIEAPVELIPLSTNYISPLQNLFRPILNCKVSNPYNVNKQHYGIDLVAEEEETVYAAADGFIIMAEYHEDNGYVIGISSRDDVLTFYKHNSALYKKLGDFVSAGTPIAVMGNSGENSTGPHLHFELWYKGIPKDPALYISFK